MEQEKNDVQPQAPPVEDDEAPRILHSRILEPGPDLKKKLFSGNWKNKALWALLAILVVVLFYLVWSVFFASPAGNLKALTSAPSSLPIADPTQRAAQPAVAATVPDPGRDDPSGGRNPGFIPTRSPFSLRPLFPQYDTTPKKTGLQGIVIGRSGESYALLNNKIVKKGDQVDDKLVEAIEDGFVVLRNAEGERVRVESSARPA